MAVTLTGSRPKSADDVTLAVTWLAVTVPAWVRTVAVRKRALGTELYVAYSGSGATDGGAVGVGQGRLTSLAGSPGIEDIRLTPGRSSPNSASERTLYIAAGGVIVVDVEYTEAIS